MDNEKDLITFPRARIITCLKGKEDMNLDSLVQETGLSRGAVKHHLTILEKNKLITITERGGKTRGRPKKINLTNKATPIQKEILDKFEMFAKFFKK